MYGEDVAPAGKVVVNAPAGSIDAHCLCGVRVNRTYKARPPHHQGRPLGTLVAFLWCCPGDAAAHRLRARDATVLSHDKRLEARAWAAAHLPEGILRLERPQRADEDSQEPERIA